MVPQEELEQLNRTLEDVFPSTRPYLCLSKPQKSVETESSRQTGASLFSSRYCDSHMTPSPFHCIGHSLRCHQLIELAQFAGMCADRDEDDDTYSLEMMTYLNDDDVISVTRPPCLNSVVEGANPEDNRLGVRDCESNKIVVKRKTKKAARLFPDDEDDFVKCLRARRLSGSSDDEDPLPRAFQSQRVAKNTAMPVDQPASKKRADVVRNDVSFDSLLPQLSQFTVPSFKVRPFSSKSRSVITAAPPSDETFGGLLSQLPTSEEAHNDGKLMQDEEQGQDIMIPFGHLIVRNDNKLPTARAASSHGLSSGAVIDMKDCLNDTQEDKNFMGMSVGGKDKTSASMVGPPAEHKMVHIVSENPPAMLQAKRKPAEGNVRQCAASRLQAFQFVKKDDKSHKNTSVSGDSALPCVVTGRTVIPDSASEGNSDEEQDQIEAIRRPRHARHKPNVFRSPDTPVRKLGKQQKAIVRTSNLEESDDEFESAIGRPSKETKHADCKRLDANSACSSKQPQSDVKDEGLHRDSRRPGSARQWQLKDGSKKRKRKATVGREFLDEEAELSSDHASIVSSDENAGSEVDGYVADSFIDDNTQSTERSPQVRRHNKTSPLDMQAVYRRSLMSPSCQRGQYKLVFGHQRNGRRLHYSSSELDSSFINDNNGSDMDGSQADEDNRLVMSEEEESEEIDSKVGDREMGFASPSFVSAGVKERRRRRAVLEVSSEHDSTASVEPTKKSPRLSAIATSPVLCVSPRRSVQSPSRFTSRNVSGNQSTCFGTADREPPATHSLPDCHRSSVPSDVLIPTEPSQFDMVVFLHEVSLSRLDVGVSNSLMTIWTSSSSSWTNKSSVKEHQNPQELELFMQSGLR